MLAAGRNASPQATDALEKLCRTYWYPLYAFVRRQGNSAHDAEDLIQEFFARLLEKDYLAGVQPGKGKFRTFLLTSLGHFLSNERDKARSQKRGGGRSFISLDDAKAENRYQMEPASDLSPEKIFERRWAIALLDQALAGLREEALTAGKVHLFDELKVFITDKGDAGDYPAAATRLAMTEVAVRVAVHRLRARYGELLRAEIAQTVSSPAEIDEEIRHLFAVFGGT